MNRKKVHVSPCVEMIMIETSHSVAVNDSFDSEMTEGEAGANTTQWEDFPSKESDNYSLWDNE